MYMRASLGFEAEGGSNKACKLKKSLYGLKQSPRAWFTRFSTVMKDLGYNQGQANHTLFVKKNKSGKQAILIVYVDDMVISGDDEVEIGNLKKKLQAEFMVKDLGELKYFLGMEVARSHKGIFISQRKYMLDLLKKTRKLGCKLSSTSLERHWKHKVSESDPPVNKESYQHLVGKLIHLSHMRPDIAFSGSIVSQFMHASTKRHMEAANQILKYLKGSPGKCLLLKKTGVRDVVDFSNADWAGVADDSKSTTRYSTKVWGNLVT